MVIFIYKLSDYKMMIIKLKKYLFI